MVASGFGKCCAPHPFLECTLGTAAEEVQYRRGSPCRPHILNTGLPTPPTARDCTGKTGPGSFIRTDNGPKGEVVAIIEPSWICANLRKLFKIDFISMSLHS